MANAAANVGKSKSSDLEPAKKSSSTNAQREARRRILIALLTIQFIWIGPYIVVKP